MASFILPLSVSLKQKVIGQITHILVIGRYYAKVHISALLAFMHFWQKKSVLLRTLALLHLTIVNDQSNYILPVTTLHVYIVSATLYFMYILQWQNVACFTSVGGECAVHGASVVIQSLVYKPRFMYWILTSKTKSCRLSSFWKFFVLKSLVHLVTGECL